MVAAVNELGATKKEIHLAGMAADAFACLTMVDVKDDDSKQHMFAAASLLLDIISCTVGKQNDLPLWERARSRAG